MKAIITLLLSMTLSGCLFTKEVIVYKTNYVYREIPADYLRIPENVVDLNLTDPLLSQKVVSEWITKKNKRELDLEAQLRSVDTLQKIYVKETEELNKNVKKSIGQL